MQIMLSLRRYARSAGPIGASLVVKFAPLRTLGGADRGEFGKLCPKLPVADSIHSPHCAARPEP